MQRQGKRNNPIGTIETREGENIQMYEHPSSRKVSLSKLPVGCDCANQDFKLFYFDIEGKVKKIADKSIKKAIVYKGATFCNAVKSEGLEDDRVLMALPTTDLGQKLVLQTILLENEKYMLAVFRKDIGALFLNICSKTDGKRVRGTNYLSVGFGSDGKQVLKDIKNCFGECDALLALLSKNEQLNEAATKRTEYVVYLQGIENVKCD